VLAWRPPRSTVAWAVTLLASAGLLLLETVRVTTHSSRALRTIEARPLKNLDIPDLPPPVPATQALSAATLQAAIRDGALFHASRFWVPPAPPPIPPPDVQFRSAVALPKGKSVAILSQGTGTLRVHLHETVGSWTVEDISVSRVLLKAGSQSIELLPRGKTARAEVARINGGTLLGRLSQAARPGRANVATPSSPTTSAQEPLRLYRPPTS
jgi:hypothetical protein